MAKIVRLPAPLDSDDHARANAERTRRLFQWAAAVLRNLGLTKAVAQATSVVQLRGITLNGDGAEVSLAIRDALHPATGDRQDHFRGLREGALKKILKNRLDDLKRDREKVLLRNAGAKQHDWTDDLILNAKGEIIPNLANLILILRKAPKWEGVLAYDEFNARVIIRKRPPWGEEEVDAPWTDHHESMTRAWFVAITEVLKHALGFSREDWTQSAQNRVTKNPDTFRLRPLSAARKRTTPTPLPPRVRRRMPSAARQSSVRGSS